MTHFSANVSIRFTLLQFALVVIVLWFVFGEPLSAVAGLFYPSGVAPWEEIDLVYYPDKLDLSAPEITPDLGSLAGCRTWAYHLAGQLGDSRLERGRYECRTVSIRLFGSERNYRLSLQ